MSHNKVHSLGKVPFSWENSPGISKVNPKEGPKDVGQVTHKLLPPPPCPSDSPKVVGVDLQIPLPPCTFQPPMRSSSRKGDKREDPFLAAYVVCTKSVGHGKTKLGKNKHRGGGRWLGWSLFEFSCKRSSGVREDSLVRFTNLPHDPSEDL